MFTITSWVSASMPIDGNNNDPRFPFCYRPLRIQPERPFSSQFSSARCCRNKMHFHFSLLSLWTFSCCMIDYWLYCISFSSHFLVVFIILYISIGYVKVAVNSKQLAILDEISQWVIYSYSFAYRRPILMHRTHFIQNILKKWPKSSIFKIRTAVATKTTSPL